MKKPDWRTGQRQLILLLALVTACLAPGEAARAAGDAAPYVAIGKFEEPLLRGAMRTQDAPTTLTEKFLAAVADAQVAEAREISKDLVAITDANSQLIWHGQGAQKQVLVVTWTGWGGYAGSVGTTTTLPRDVWVTVAPELKKFCASHGVSAQERTLRLEQLLGLPPNNGKSYFVQFWASPDDLFRPSADPEITDAEAGLDWPRSARFVTVSPDYMTWFNSLKASSYGTNGYPWTRLGYTYDWGNPAGPIGLSEFVIRAGATVAVESVSTNDQYFSGPSGPASLWTKYQ